MVLVMLATGVVMVGKEKEELLMRWFSGEFFGDTDQVETDLQSFSYQPHLRLQLRSLNHLRSKLRLSVKTGQIKAKVQVMQLLQIGWKSYLQPPVTAEGRGAKWQQK